jgi:hypothetical protein
MNLGNSCPVVFPESGCELLDSSTCAGHSLVDPIHTDLGVFGCERVL